MNITVDFIPKPGDKIKRKSPSGKDMTYIRVTCPNCGEGRWITIYSAKKASYTGLCKKCSIKLNPFC